MLKRLTNTKNFSTIDYSIRREKEEAMHKRMKRLISRLIEWLAARGLNDAEILDCIKYITK